MSPHAVAMKSLVCTFAFALVGLASSVPVQQREDGGGGSVDTAVGGGFATVLWSVLEDCLGGDDLDEPTAVCLKYRAMTALDRALSKPTLVIADGLVLAARAGKSLTIDPHAEKADRAALDAVKDSNRKSAMLDDMLATRMETLMSSRTIVLDGAVGQEGRKKKDKAMQQAMMMAGMMAAAVMGPMALKIIMLMAGKALLLSKIALVLSGIIALKKLLQPQQSGHESESHHYGRSLQLDAHDMAYSGQRQ
uniref:Transmembrane protein n=1 Tax=Sipha flava TaxID=143950 RepID=A0A2S2Q173_9HEMI